MAKHLTRNLQEYGFDMDANGQFSCFCRLPFEQPCSDFVPGQTYLLCNSRNYRTYRSNSQFLVAGNRNVMLSTMSDNS